jgi:5'-nucleotidase
MRKRIALDMDEVVADVMPKFLHLYETEFGTTPNPDDYAGGKVYDLPGAAHIRNRLHDKGFFRDLPLMPDSRDVIMELNETYDIFFTTAAMEFRNCLEDKYDWLQEHFPFMTWKRYVFCGDKSILRADYMIDDHVRNIAAFQGQGLLYTASHNLDEHRFPRVNNWQEVRAFFANERTNAPA